MATKKTDKVSKAKAVKKPTIYASCIYGGALKSGYSIIQASHEHPEIIFEQLKKYYGCDIKGRFCKSTNSIETILEIIEKDLEDKKDAKSDILYKESVTDIIKVIKKATDAKKCTTMGVYEKEIDKENEKESEESDDNEAESETVFKNVENKTAKKNKKTDDDDEDDNNNLKKEVKKEVTKKDTKSKEKELEEKSKNKKETKETKETKDKVTKNSKVSKKFL